MQGMPGIFQNNSIMKNIYFKIKHFLFMVLSFFLSFLPRRNRQACFMFHAVNDHPNPLDIWGNTLSIKKFSYFIDQIVKYKIKTFKVHEIDIKNGKITQNGIILTFDDGFLDNYENVFPLLKKHSLKATFFVSPKKIMRGIDGLYPYMNIQQLKEVYQSGLVEIGLHGYDHQDQTLFSITESQRMLKKSIDFFNEYDIKVRSFAYPYGNVQVCYKELFEDSLIQYSFCSDKAYLDHIEDRYKIPRIEISRYSSNCEMKVMLKGNFIF